MFTLAGSEHHIRKIYILNPLIFLWSFGIVFMYSSRFRCKEWFDDMQHKISLISGQRFFVQYEHGISESDTERMDMTLSIHSCKHLWSTFECLTQFEEDNPSANKKVTYIAQSNQFTWAHSGWGPDGESWAVSYGRLTKHTPPVQTHLTELLD